MRLPAVPEHAVSKTLSLLAAASLLVSPVLSTAAAAAPPPPPPASSSSSTTPSTPSMAPGSRYPKVDVHSHFVPDFYRDELVATGNEKVDGMPGIPDWSAAAHLAMMRAVNVTHAILSISSPGVSFYHTTAAAGAARDKTIALAARCNDFAAQTVADHPDDFSFFATLPLPHVDAALDEARRVADVGGRVGYGLLTSYPAPHVGEAEEDPTGGSSSTTTTTTTTGNSTTFGRLFLGDAAFDPLWEALDAESAVVFIHPTTPVSSTCGCASSYPMSEYPAPLLEFFFDTARAATSLLLARVPQRFPRLSFVLSHAGGALPPVAARIALFSAVGILPGEPVSEDEVREILDTRFFYDAAGSPVPGQVTALATGGGMGVHVAERMVYGSDFPFTKADAIAGLAERLETEWRATNAAPGGSAVQEVKKVLANGGRFLKEGRGEWL